MTERLFDGTAGRLARLALVLAASMLLAWFASATPPALSPQAPPDRFSAGRALLDIARLARSPHPLGSPEDAAVRDQLATRLRALGLTPTIQHVGNVRPWGSRSQGAFAVDNLVARLPGADPRAPGLLLLSHYDSVARSPGAADDMASVATELEIARLLKRGQPPARDVVFGFTDGEETGLLGAQALFGDPALSRDIGFVLNMDVRGGGGRAMMFQLGSKSGGAIDPFARTAIQPESNSLAAYLYDKMPNDTDFSVAIAHGLAGLNYAFIGRPALYHTAAAVPGAVEPGAVQSLGDQVWAMTRQLAFAPALPSPAPDAVWFDLFGRVVVAYPPVLGWLPIRLSALLLAVAAWRRKPTLAAVAVGAAQSLGAALLAALLLAAYGRLFVTSYYQALGQAPQTEIATALVVLASALLASNLGPVTSRPADRWLGAAALGWVIAVALQALAPLTAFLAARPALAAGAALAVGGSRSSGVGVGMAASILALGFLMETWHAVILGVGLTAPPLSAALCPVAFSVLAPWLDLRGLGRSSGQARGEVGAGVSPPVERASVHGAFQRP